MAAPTPKLIDALLSTAERLGTDVPYSWGNLGTCNCGHLTQTLTGQTGPNIHRLASSKGLDWGELSATHCTTSGAPVDELVSTLLREGLSLHDIQHLEELDDPKVLAALGPAYPKHLERNRRDHAIAYFRAWAKVLSGQLGS